MANTINNGPAKSLAYYPVSGTDIDDTGANLKWDPVTNQVTLFGRLQVYKNVASTNDTSLSLVHYGSPFVPVYISRSLGTTTNPAKVTTGTYIGGISFAGRANTTFRTGAYIDAVVDGAVSDNSMPSKIVFGTHNGSTLAVRAELSKLGELKVNTIKDYSGGILTLNPATKLDLGVASKISISGGSAGQVLSLNTAGVLEWTNVASSELYAPIIRNAINAGTGIAFNKATGYISNTITNTNQLTNGAGFITASNVTWNNILNRAGSTAGPSEISIGRLAGSLNQGEQSVAIGSGSGTTNQGPFAVAVGVNAGMQYQGTASTAIGPSAATHNQGTRAVSLGYGAGEWNQGDFAIAIGSGAGNGTMTSGQGDYSINIGGFNNDEEWMDLPTQPSNSIILNASGSRLDVENSGFFVKPIRNHDTTKALYYDTEFGEITYSEVIPVVRETPPTTATSSGITGQIAYDSNYIYICTATNTWKRSALSSW